MHASILKATADADLLEASNRGATFIWSVTAWTAARRCTFAWGSGIMPGGCVRVARALLRLICLREARRNARELWGAGT